MYARIVTICLLVAAGAIAQEAGFTSPLAKRAEERYRNAVRRATEDYIRELKAAQEIAMRDRQLDEATRIKEAVERLVLTAQGQEVVVPATHGPRNPLGTGVVLKARQRFRLVPYPEDKWNGIRDKSDFVDYMGYPDRMGRKYWWMRMHWQIGSAEAIPVVDGEVQTAPVAGELLLFGMDTITSDNSGQIRVVVVVE